MIDCTLIRDLLPLYIDGLCSAETENHIKAHLKACPDCRAIHEQRQSSPAVRIKEPERVTFADGLKALTRKIRLKHLRNLLIALLIAFVLVIDFLFAMTRLRWTHSQTMPLSQYQIALGKTLSGRLYYRYDFLGKSYEGNAHYDIENGILYCWYATPVINRSSSPAYEDFTALELIERDGRIYRIAERRVDTDNIISYVLGEEIIEIRQGAPDGEQQLLYRSGDALPVIEPAFTWTNIGASVVYLADGREQIVLESMNGYGLNGYLVEGKGD